jgi:hypothetical protein
MISLIDFSESGLLSGFGFSDEFDGRIGFCCAIAEQRQTNRTLKQVVLAMAVTFTSRNGSEYV